MKIGLKYDPKDGVKDISEFLFDDVFLTGSKDGFEDGVKDKLEDGCKDDAGDKLNNERSDVGFRCDVENRFKYDLVGGFKDRAK